jgi:hypothetical protein
MPAIVGSADVAVAEKFHLVFPQADPAKPPA